MNSEQTIVPLTDAQKAALRAVFDRCEIKVEGADAPLTFDGFVKSVQPMLGSDGAIVVRWLGMWLAIEPDGYTHS